MPDGWTDHELLLALFQAALSIPSAVLILGILLVFATLGACTFLVALASILDRAIVYLWARRWWRKREPVELWSPGALRAMAIHDKLRAIVDRERDPELGGSVYIPPISGLQVTERRLYPIERELKEQREAENAWRQQNQKVVK